MTKDNRYHSRTKHIDIRYHWIRDQVEAGNLEVDYVPTEEQLADCLTKGLNGPLVKHFAEALGLRV